MSHNEVIHLLYTLARPILSSFAIADAPKPLSRKFLDLDLSRFDAAPLIAFTAPKETEYGTETDG